METIGVSTTSREEFLDITREVSEVVAEDEVETGICHLFVPHTTAGVAINEGSDPAVAKDIITALGRLVPEEGDYLHREGNSDAHIKATLVGSQLSIPCREGQLTLGTWQNIFLCEFDGPRMRQIHVVLKRC